MLEISLLFFISRLTLTSDFPFRCEIINTHFTKNLDSKIWMRANPIANQTSVDSSVSLVSIERQIYRSSRTLDRNFHRLAWSHLAKPVLYPRKIVFIVLILLEHHWNNPLPWDEGEICIGKLVAYEPRTISASTRLLFLHTQITFQHPYYAVDSLGIAFNSARQLLTVIFLEPGRLSIVWTLSGDLEVKPLFPVKWL